MSQRADILSTCVTFCAGAGLDVTKAVELFEELRDDLDMCWDEEYSGQDEIIGALTGMLKQRDMLYDIPHYRIKQMIKELEA